MRGIESILIIKVGVLPICVYDSFDAVLCSCFLTIWPGVCFDVRSQEKDKARKAMQHGRPPKNCREAFTAEGDQVFPNRYYTSEFSLAKYLGGDIETEIR